MDGTLAQIITDLLQSQQAQVKLQTEVERLTKEGDALRALLTKGSDSDGS